METVTAALVCLLAPLIQLTFLRRRHLRIIPSAFNVHPSLPFTELMVTDVTTATRHEIYSAVVKRHNTFFDSYLLLWQYWIIQAWRHGDEEEEEDSSWAGIFLEPHNLGTNFFIIYYKRSINVALGLEFLSSRLWNSNWWLKNLFLIFTIWNKCMHKQYGICIPIIILNILLRLSNCCISVKWAAFMDFRDIKEY